VKITKRDSDNPTRELLEKAAQQSNHEYTIKGDRLVFRECPFCGHDDGPRYAGGLRAVMYLGEPDPGGFSCKKCDEITGPYVMFKTLGVEIEKQASTVSARIRAAIGSPVSDSGSPKPVPVSANKVIEMHKRSVGLLLSAEGSPVLAYLLSRGLMDDADEYHKLPDHLKTIGAWKYRDGTLGVAWWYFDVKTKEPMLCKFRAASDRAKGSLRMMGKWPSGIEIVPCYREHLYDPSLGEVLICEGEADAESWALLNIPNVISLPDGADSANAAYDVLGSAMSVHMSLDNDNAGSKAAARLRSIMHGDAVVYRVTLDKESGGFYKDANDALRGEGDGGQEFLYDSYSKALVAGEPVLRFSREYVETGFKNWDSKYYGLRMGGYTHIFGGPGEGKTTWSWSLLLRLNARGVRCGYVSLEEPCADLATDMAGSMCGITRGQMIKMHRAGDAQELKKSEDALDSSLHALSRNVSFFGKGQEWGDHVDPEYSAMISAVEMAMRGGCRVIVIDNFSIMRNKLTTPSAGRKGATITDYSAASIVSQDVLRLAKTGNVHIILLNHVSGSGSAYGKARLDPLAELSFHCKRSGESTILGPSKVRLSDGSPQGLRFVMSLSGGALIDSGLVPLKGKGEVGENSDRQGGEFNM
jgi:ATP:corrinoid adenosyltransferase